MDKFNYLDNVASLRALEKHANAVLDQITMWEPDKGGFYVPIPICSNRMTSWYVPQTSPFYSVENMTFTDQGVLVSLRFNNALISMTCSSFWPPDTTLEPRALESLFISRDVLLDDSLLKDYIELNKKQYSDFNELSKAKRELMKAPPSTPCQAEPTMQMVTSGYVSHNPCADVALTIGERK